VSTLITKSATAKNQAQQEEYLAQANIIGWGGEQAPKALADYYLANGRYDKAWRTLSQWPLKPDYARLGNYALIAQEYTPAQRFYARAISQKGTAAAHVSLAAAQFNRGDLKNGCANAAKATKLDLNYEKAQQMAAVCLLINPKETTLQRANYPLLASAQLSSARGQGVFLIQNKIYKEGEKRLASTAKAPADWLMLARLASARGDHKLAVQRGEQGINLDRSNPELNRLLADSYRALGQAKADFYTRRLESLPLDK
jgi:Tfp pilus assembly protein PilF